MPAQPSWRPRAWAWPCTAWEWATHGSGRGRHCAFPPAAAFFCAGPGVGAGIGLLAVLAVAHIMVPATVALTWAAAAMAGYIWCARRGWGMSCAKSKGQRRRWQESLLLAAAFCLLMLKASHAPGYWDDASYHLPMARLFMRHHGLAVDEYLRFPYFPANMQLLMAAGLQLSGPVLAQMLATLPVFVTLIGLMGCAQWMLGSAVWGVFASLAYATTQPVRETLGFAYVDYGLALFCLAALLAAAVWYERGDVGDRRWLLPAAVFAGVAGGIKFAGLVFAAMLGLAILVLARRPRPALWFGAVCAATAGGWYLRSYWFSGDPIHPAGGGDLRLSPLERRRPDQPIHGTRPAWSGKDVDPLFRCLRSCEGANSLAGPCFSFVLARHAAGHGAAVGRAGHVLPLLVLCDAGQPVSGAGAPGCLSSRRGNVEPRVARHRVGRRHAASTEARPGVCCGLGGSCHTRRNVADPMVCSAAVSGAIGLSACPCARQQSQCHGAAIWHASAEHRV